MSEENVASEDNVASEEASGTRVHDAFAGTHVYGYEINYETGDPVTGSCVGQDQVCAIVTSHQCHGRFYCQGHLQVHADKGKADGLTFRYGGLLNPEVEVSEEYRDLDMDTL